MVQALFLKLCVFVALMHTALGSLSDYVGENFVPSDPLNTPWLGSAISISADGSTMAVGGPYDDSGTNVNYVGAVWMYNWNGSSSSWVEDIKISPSSWSGTIGPFFGEAVALSADGNTLAVGAGEDSEIINQGGAVFIYKRAQGVWNFDVKVVGNNYADTTDDRTRMGRSLALSQDGVLLIAAGGNDNFGAGAVWIFSNDFDSTWNQVQTLYATDAEGDTSSDATSPKFGMGGIALSEDKNTLVIGSNYEGMSVTMAAHEGCVRVFVRDNTTGLFSQQGNKLTITGQIEPWTAGSPSCGNSVGLSSDGNTLAFGCHGDESITAGHRVGAVFVFKRAAGVWTQYGSKVVPNDYSTNQGWPVYFGFSLAMTADGKSLYVGGYGDTPVNTPEEGSLWKFYEDGSGDFVQDGVRLGPPSYTERPKFGYAVAVSPDAYKLAVGAVKDDSNLGTLWTFTAPAEPTAAPTVMPTAEPTDAPTAMPTAEPTAMPTAEPTAMPTAEPTAIPTAEPTAMPTADPTAIPTAEPTALSTAGPTVVATVMPTVASPAASSWTYADTAATCMGTMSSPCGPAHWGKLYESCNNVMQSPIDIRNGIARVDNFPSFPVNFRGCKHWKQSVGAGGYEVTFERDECPLDVKYKGIDYELTHLMIHSPSEHTLSGHSFGAEVQMVHHNHEHGDFIVSVMLDATAPARAFMPMHNNSFFDTIGRSFVRMSPEGIPLHVGSHKNRLNPYSSLLPATPAVYAYEGSFTTPPCVEHVQWLVYAESTAISVDDLNGIRANPVGESLLNGMGNNNRPIQSRNGRKVWFTA